MSNKHQTTKYDLECTEKDEQGIGKTYFPIEVRYKGSKEKTIVNTSDDIRNDVGFVVLRTRIGQ